jgi:hypothetical protein
VVSCQEGVTEYCGLWIPVHRCTSELCGVRQRCARWAQKLESSIQTKTCEVTEDLRGKAVEKNTVADKISKEFCEALPSGH